MVDEGYEKVYGIYFMDADYKKGVRRMFAEIGVDRGVGVGGSAGFGMEADGCRRRIVNVGGSARGEMEADDDDDAVGARCWGVSRGVYGGYCGLCA